MDRFAYVFGDVFAIEIATPQLTLGRSKASLSGLLEVFDAKRRIFGRPKRPEKTAKPKVFLRHETSAVRGLLHPFVPFCEVLCGPYSAAIADREFVHRVDVALLGGFQIERERFLFVFLDAFAIAITSPEFVGGGGVAAIGGF